MRVVMGELELHSRTGLSGGSAPGRGMGDFLRHTMHPLCPPVNLGCLVLKEAEQWRSMCDIWRHHHCEEKCAILKNYGPKTLVIWLTSFAQRGLADDDGLKFCGLLILCYASQIVHSFYYIPAFRSRCSLSVTRQAETHLIPSTPLCPRRPSAYSTVIQGSSD